MKPRVGFLFLLPRQNHGKDYQDYHILEKIELRSQACLCALCIYKKFDCSHKVDFLNLNILIIIRAMFM